MAGGGKRVALTFDAGGAPDGGERILATLAAQGVPATFFLTGDFAIEFPGLARRIAQRFPVGNHSMTHPDLTKLTTSEVRNQVERARQAILQVTGADPRPYFRFPFGEVDSRVISVVNSLCYVPFRWSVDSLGWQGTSGGMSAAKVRTRVVNGVGDGGIALLHVGSNPDDHTSLDADALPGIIADLRSAGYTFVTLEQVLPPTP